MKISKDIVNGGIYQLVQKMHTLEEENKELVTKCNQLEKEKMAMQDTIEELNIMRCELEDEKAKDWFKMTKKINIATHALIDIFTKLDKKDIVLLSNPPQENEHTVFARIIDTAFKQIQEVK